VTRDSNTDWPRGLLRAIRSTVDALPSEEDVRAGVEAIDELISFLQKLRTQLAAQPTAGKREDVERALVVLESFLGASRGPVMLAAPKGQRSRAPERDVDVEELRKELSGLDLDEIRNRLQDHKRYSVDTLRRLAQVFGVRVDARLARDDLADAILKRGFANPRTYQGLRGGVDKSSDAAGRNEPKK